MNKILFIIFTIISLAGCSNKQISLENIEYKDHVEYGTNLIPCEIIKSVEGTEPSKSDNSNVVYAGNHRISCSDLNTKSLGMQKVYVNIDKQLFVLEIEVADTVKPVIRSDEEIDIKELPDNEESFDIESYFEIEDSSEYEIKIIGKVNLKENGRYPVTLVATDEYGNESSKDVVFNVNLEENEPEGKPIVKPSVRPTNREETNQQPEEPANPDPVPTKPQLPTPPSINCIAGSKHISGISNPNDIYGMTQKLMLENNAKSAWAEATGQDEWDIYWSCE